MVQNKKGDRRERELVNALYDSAWAVMRAPASGAATERELPDVLTGNGECFAAIELKASGGDRIYIDDEEITDLKFFAEQFGAIPLIGVIFDVKHGEPAYGNDAHPGFYFFETEDVYRTNSGNYRIDRETALNEGIAYPEFVENPFDE